MAGKLSAMLRNSRPAWGQSSAWLSWWAVGFAVWLVLDDSRRPAELVAGAIAAILGATAVTLVKCDAPVVPRRRWLRRIWRPPLALVADLRVLVLVLAAALVHRRRSPGRLRTLRFDPAGATDREQAVARALAAYAGSLAPATVVIAVDPRRRLMLVHELVPRRGRTDADPLELG